MATFMARAMACFTIFILCLLSFSSTPRGDDQSLDNGWTDQNQSQAVDEFSKQMIEKAADLLREKFEDFSLREMGLGALHDMSQRLQTTSRIVNDETMVTKMAEKLTAKMEASSEILHEMKRIILNSSEESSTSFIHPCPLQYDQLENLEMNNDKVIVNIPKKTSKLGTEHLLNKYNIKVERQGYLSTSDGGGVKECKEEATGSARQLLHNVMQTQSKSVVILLDCGTYMGLDGLHTTAGIAKEVLELLGAKDTVVLIHLDGEPRTVSFNSNCTKDELNPFAHVTDAARDNLSRYLSSVEVDDVDANITAGLELLHKVMVEVKHFEELLVIYLGKQSSIIKQISEINTAVKQVVDLKTFNVIFTGCSVPDPIEFVSTLPSFSNINYERQTSEECPLELFLCSDWLINLNSSQSAGEIASHLLLKLPLHPVKGDEMRVAPPHWELKPASSSLASFLIPLYLPISHKGLIFLHLYLSDLAEDVIYFNSFSISHRAFLIDFAGHVIAHSSYPRPELIVTKPRLIHITDLENDSNFQNVKSNMLQTSVGKMKFNATSYVWRWVKDIYIICIVSSGSDKTQSSVVHLVGTAPQELQHHRMDLLPPANAPLCQHFLTVSTINKGTLFLSPSSFQSPFSYLYHLQKTKDISITFMQRYMAYLKDDTRLLSNPGLKAEVRDSVGILHHLLSFFKDSHIKGLHNKYIVRRYAATEHGVLVLFPGTILESDFEPNKKAWFLGALRNPGKVILTPPYLDIGGAGYIVTISQVSTENVHTSTPVVVSVDITMRYLYKMLQQVFPVCASSFMRCFLIDDGGYLLSHPGIVDPSNFARIDQPHITHKESHIVNDMLNHRNLVLKKLCKNYADNTLQRYYQFNTSLDRVLSNFVQGDHYARYHIAAVPGTNIFIGMVNSSSYTGVFCPCSIENRLCLNCNRMEQNECECPCECQLPESECSSSTRDTPLCQFESDRLHRYSFSFITRRYTFAPHLHSCFDFQCESYTSKHSCLGVLGCEWCELSRDRETLLMSPFCTAQPRCFGGVLNAPTPYQIGLFGQVTQDELSPAYSAVGPIVGCIVALCLILAIAVYCYKQNSSSTANQEPFSQSQNTWPHRPVPLGLIAADQDILDERSGHQDQLLLAAEPPVSPYRILTGYRRPPTAGESDHGYSTMTPHDDSEHRAFALVEPPSSPSLSTPRSSATDLPLTVLPCGKNSILAPVTVHRHMEAT